MLKPYVIVLAANSREGMIYAQRAGLPRGRHRVVSRASQIRRLRSAEIHELPGFAKRKDRHAINAALRWTRGERLRVEMPGRTQKEQFPPTPVGPTLRDLEVAYRYNALRSAAAQASEDLGELVVPLDLEDILEPTPVATQPEGRKRRRKCPVCDSLVWNDDDPAHDPGIHAEHERELQAKSFFGGP